MSDTPDQTDGADAPATAETTPTPATPPKVTQRIIAQYIRDLSFENVLAQKGLTGELQPEVSVGVNLDARKRGGENQYEVITKLKITSKAKNTGDTIFLMEVEYAGVFHVEGLPDEQMHPYLLIECPRMTFPFLRRIVSDVTRDGGFMPINLETIDFLALYRNELTRRAQAQQAASATPQN